VSRAKGRHSRRTSWRTQAAPVTVTHADGTVEKITQSRNEVRETIKKGRRSPLRAAAVVQERQEWQRAAGVGLAPRTTIEEPLRGA
jgi:hypothetical protein